MNHETLLSEINYDPLSGLFFWLKGGRGRKVFSPAGHRDNAKGYRRIKINEEYFLAHRLAWFYMHKCWPDGQIDHINGDKDDNRILNLRVVDGSLNQQNRRRARTTNKCGLLGASKSGNKWRAQIRKPNGGETIHLGTYNTAEEAHDAHVEAKRAMHPGCTI